MNTWADGAMGEVRDQVTGEQWHTLVMNAPFPVGWTQQRLSIIRVGTLAWSSTDVDRGRR